jgi:hypothetical protein
MHINIIKMRVNRNKKYMESIKKLLMRLIVWNSNFLINIFMLLGRKAILSRKKGNCVIKLGEMGGWSWGAIWRGSVRKFRGSWRCFWNLKKKRIIWWEKLINLRIWGKLLGNIQLLMNSC